MKTKLWQSSSTQMHPLVDTYTVGDDTVYDQLLLDYDIQASIAHATMLGEVGLLTRQESAQLTDALNALHTAWQDGTFFIQPDDEDGHTAIESYLTNSLGDVGKKIHTGRSRNDQALVMMRLYMKDKITQIEALTHKLASTFRQAAATHADTPMPGYTHMQKAMPTTVGTWLGAYQDGFADLAASISSTKQLLNQNPLGSMAGFGSSLPIDQTLTTKLLGFKKPQGNPMYCGISRGLFELLAVQSALPVMLLAGKFASDMMLFTTQEFGFFSLPRSFTTGSSVMPHKANYDLFEIMRGKAHGFVSYQTQLAAISCGIGSGYHRDLQLTKKPVIEALSTAKDTLELLLAAVPEIKVHRSKLSAAITPEMHSVAAIDNLVAGGTPFRDAYRQVKDQLHD